MLRIAIGLVRTRTELIAGLHLGGEVHFAVRRSIALAALGLLAALPNIASAQKCVQSGSTVEEGAVECQPATIIEVNHYGPTGISSMLPWCPDNVHDEAAVEQCLLTRMTTFRSCFVRHDLVRDWYYGGRWGNAGVDNYRQMYKDYRTIYGTIRWNESGTANYCDTSAAYQWGWDWAMVKRLRAQCPPGMLFFTWWYEADGGDSSPMCGNPKRQQCLRPGNPIDMATGAKLLTEQHIALDPVVGIQFAWHYNSARQSFISVQPPGTSPLVGAPASTHPLIFADRVWRHSYDKQLFYSPAGRRPSVRIVRPDQAEDTYFVQEAGLWRRTQSMGQDALTESPSTPSSRWLYRSADNVIEVYNDSGQLVQLQEPNGRRFDLIYASGRLERVRDVYGRFIRFEYDATTGLMSAAITSAGNRYTYSWDGNTRTLQSTTFPGNAVRRYLYEASYKHLLTGITDELGKRFATYAYDGNQKAALTEHAGGVNRFSVTHGIWPQPNYPAGVPATVTGPTGATANVYWRQLGQGLSWDYYRPVRESLAGLSAAVPGLAGTWQSAENDANGNVTMSRDFAGVVTRAAFDLARNLETQRTENADSADARATNIQWHPDWNLSTRTARPNSITTVLYNGQTYNGQAIACAPANAQFAGKPLPLPCWVIEQPTADTSGSQGFNAAPSGNATVTRTNYNTSGQPLIVEVYENVAPALTASPTSLPGMQQPTQRRSYVYATAADANYSKGDLQTLTLELPALSPAPPAQVTAFRRYNKRGQVLEFQSPDGSVSTLTYHARGWLTQYSFLPAGGNLQTTRYTYDAAGQLKRMTLPDGVLVNFTFDDAQRLTSIYDSQGNRETYVLDNAGNRSLQRVGSIDALMRNLARAMFPSVALPIGPTALVSAAPPVLLAAIGPIGDFAEPDTLAPLSPSALDETILAQVPPPPRTLPTSPAWSPPAPSMADPSLLMDRFGPHERSLREEIERLLAKCECPPDGGFDKPTLTTLSWAHMIVSGHLAPTWSNKSYFTETVSQGFLDEVMSKNRLVVNGDRVQYYVPDMGRVVGMSPSGGGNFEPRRDVTVIVQRTNCFNKFLAGWRIANEVITMFPGRPNRR